LVVVGRDCTARAFGTSYESACPDETTLRCQNLGFSKILVSQ
jgi:hypothetical protein